MTSLCVLTPDRGSGSGWARYTEEVLVHLRDRYDVTLIEDLPKPYELYRRPDRSLRTALGLREAVEQHDALLSLISYPYSVVSYLATMGTDTPYFLSAHGTYAVRPLYEWQCVGAARALRGAAGIFPVSEFTANAIREKVGELGTISVTRNGINPANFERTDPFDLDHRVILSVGPFKRRKGQKTAVEGFAAVADQTPDVHYHLVGGSGFDNYRESVLSVIEANDLEDRVHVEGFASDEDLRRWYETADLFALTSQYANHRFEGFPLVYLEAQRYGVPALGIETTSASEAISHEESGLVVPNDPDRVGEAMARIFTDDDLHRRLSDGAEAWAFDHTWESVVSVIASGIDEVLAERPR